MDSHTHKFRAFAALLACTLVLLALFGSTWADVSAQSIDGRVGGATSLEISPRYPEPNQVVRIRAKSFSLDLDRASIVWRVNGAVVAEGSGVTEIEFQTGAAGSASVVSMTAVEGARAETEGVTLRPASVDLIFEADAYTPPFYRGKALPSSQVPMRIIAMPQLVGGDGQPIPAGDLIFTWEENGRVLGSQSGRGKNILETDAPRIFGKNDVAVTAASLNGAVRARAFLTIRPSEPRVLFYENNPLEGMRYERALGDMFELENEEIMLTAHPFGVTGSSRTEPYLSYRWTLDGSTVKNPLEDQSSIVLRQTGGAGAASVTLTVQNLERVLQRAQSAFRVSFPGLSRNSFNES